MVVSTTLLRSCCFCVVLLVLSASICDAASHPTHSGGMHRRRKLLHSSSGSSSSLGDPTGTNGATLRLVGDGFTWAENLNFDRQGNLWVAEDMRGELYRFRKLWNVTSNSSYFEKRIWVQGFAFLLGIVVPDNSNTEIYAVAGISDDNHTLIAVDTTTPNTWRIMRQTSKIGNGLALDTTVDTLYTCCEANFIPDISQIQYGNNISLQSTWPSEAAVFADKLWAADGLFIDPVTHIMYMTESVTAMVFAYNLSNGFVPSPATLPLAPILSFHAPDVVIIDDFCIDYHLLPAASSQPTMWAANFGNGSVISFAANGGDAAPQVWATGLQTPTSVRRPIPGSVWDNGRNVFITEGGGLFPEFQKNRRVWELTLPPL